MLDILVAGEANADLLLSGVPKLELDKEKLAKGMDLVLGGSSSITAYNLARLGMRVGFASVIGDDFFGLFVEERLRSAGVDISGLRRAGGEKTGLTIWIARGKRRAGVTYPGTIALLRATEVDFSRARHLHVGAYFLLDNFHPGAAALFRRARGAGLTTSLDCNYDPAERWDSNIRRVLAATDIFFPNEIEALRLTGKRNVEAAAGELARLARIVVVKLGGRGAIVVSSGGVVRVRAVKTKVVDTTGAGDSFNAGFLASYLRGASLDECGRAGALAGARAVGRVGGTAAFE